MFVDLEVMVLWVKDGCVFDVVYVVLVGFCVYEVVVWFYEIEVKEGCDL